MIKNAVIAVLVILIALLAFYANIKANEAEMQTTMASANLQLAEQHRQAAESAEMEATRQAAAAILAQKKAEDALANCQNK